MSQIDKKKLKLTTRQILLYLIDAFVVGFDVFDGYGLHRKSVSDYYKWRDFDKVRFQQDLYRLKKEKIVKRYQQGKERYIELTPKGKEKIRGYILSELKIIIPKKWDYKWRIVIFDIPEDKKTIRDIVAGKLKRLGFLRLQKSVFVFPFDCKAEINRLKLLYDISRYVQYIVAEQIDTELDLVKYFFEQTILDEKYLK